MNIKEYLASLFSGIGFMPHGHCYLWSNDLIALHVISDALIVLAYYSIPVTLVYFVRHRRDIAFHWVFVCFAVFIMACGTTHLMEIWNIWNSTYWLSGSIKAVTALASVPTAVLLVKLVPQALALPSTKELNRVNEALQAEIAERKNVEARLREANEHLEQRVAERMKELALNSEALRVSEERFRLVVEAAPNAIIMADEQGLMTLVNGETEQLFGYARTDLLGQPVEMLIPERFRPQHPGLRSDFLQQPSARKMGAGRDLFGQRKDGSEVPIEIGLNPIRIGGGAFVLAEITNITERKQAEANLRKSQQLIEAIIDNSPAVIYVKDLEGRYLLMNRRFAEVFRFSRSDTLGKTDYDLFPKEAAEAFRAMDQRVIDAGQALTEEEEAPHPDGMHTYISVKSPLWDQAGKIYGIFGLSTDITQQKAAETLLRASEERLRLITNLVPHGIFAKNAAGRYIFVNRALAESYGRKVEEVLGKCDLDLVTDEAQARAYQEHDREVILSGETKFIPEEKNTDASGRTHFLQTTRKLFIVPETGERAVLGISVDVSERKEAEEEIQRLNTDLEKRVIARTAELEAANKELEAFSYSVSHDLRTPLRALDGFSQAMLEDFGPQLEGHGRRYLQTIRASAQRMGALIDDLLTFSRLSRTPLNRKLVITNDLVRDVLEDLDSQQEGRQLDVRLAELPSCQGDPALLRQVWINLLTNAFKYTRKRAEAVVEIGCSHEGTHDVFFVRDNGTGFDMRYADKLFGVFQRLHRAEEYEGTGVGLALVQRIIHRHGGRVWADAAIDRGATFYFTLKEQTNP